LIACNYTSKKDDYKTLHPANKNNVKIEYGNEDDNTEYCVYLDVELQEIKGGKYDGDLELSFNHFDIDKFSEIVPKDQNKSMDITYSFKENINTIAITVESYNMLFIKIPNGNQRIYKKKI